MKFKHTWVVLTLCLLWAAYGTGCGSSKQEADPAEAPGKALEEAKSAAKDAGCSIGDPSTEALVPAGYFAETGTALTSDGKALTPAGDTHLLARFPWGLAVGGKYAYVTHAEGDKQLQVYDLSGEVPEDGDADGSETAETVGRAEGEPIRPVQTISKVGGGYGMAVTADGKTLYLPGAGAMDVKVYAWQDDQLVLQREIPVGGYIGAVTLSADEKTLYTVSPTQSMFTKIVLADDGKTKVHVGNYPYDAVLSADGRTAYVSNWAGNSVSVVDTQEMSVTATIPVDKGPEGLALAENGKYLIVTNADADNLSIIDTDTNTVFRTLELDPDHSDLKSWTPNHVVVHKLSRRAYVASADHNAVEVIDTENWQILGAVPTAFYPVRLALTDDGDRMAVVNAKGWGAEPLVHTGIGLNGVLQLFEIPVESGDLEAHSLKVKNNVERTLGFFPDNNCPKILPLPVDENEKFPIEHVILVIKENKTYDEVMGSYRGQDHPGDEWHDPALAAWGWYEVEPGRWINNTPNAHSLAATFVDMVNFYADAEVSLQGHMWVTQADCTDYVEKNRFDRFPATGVDPTSVHYNKSFFHHLNKHDVSFRIYGQAVNFALEAIGDWRDRIDLKYPFWSQGVTDVDKAKEIIREWTLAENTDDEKIKNRLFPSFIYIVLPNDHTVGGDAGAPTPRTMIADNDHGMGMLVDWLSHSSFWEKSLLIAIEDDPQSGPGDHIDAHRSVCFMASPWIKRGYTGTVHYSGPSVFRTIELIFGLPPINKNTLMAPPMLDVFTDQPDSTPYTAIVPEVPVEANPSEGKFAEEAKKWDWSVFDGHDGLGDHLWRMMNGDKPRPPYAKRIDD